jgi:hypothetical protein
MKRIFYVVLIAVLLPLTAFAEKGEGQAFYEPTVLETTELADGRVISRVSVSGFVVASNPNSPFHMVNQRCSGTNIFAVGQSEPTAFGYCEGLDRNGDMFFISWANGPGGNTWQLLGGTGKFAGISGGGTTKTVFTWADGKYVINWDATWTIK